MKKIIGYNLLYYLNSKEEGDLILQEYYSDIKLNDFKEPGWYFYNKDIYIDKVVMVRACLSPREKLISEILLRVYKLKKEIEEISNL